LDIRRSYEITYKIIIGQGKYFWFGVNQISKNLTAFYL
jgi:hypothetical protein